MYKRQVLEMAISCTKFVTQGKEQQIISLKNIHSVQERNEMEAWQKLIRVLTHEIMNSITPIISLLNWEAAAGASTGCRTRGSVMTSARVPAPTASGCTATTTTNSMSAVSYTHLIGAVFPITGQIHVLGAEGFQRTVIRQGNGQMCIRDSYKVWKPV